MLLRLLSYWRNARKEIVLGGTILVFSALLELLQPWPVKWLVDHVFGKRPLAGWVHYFWPPFASANAAGGVTWVCICILVLALTHRLATLVGQFFLLRAGARLVQQLRCHACEQLHRLSLAFHDRTKVGDSLYRVAYDAHAAQTLFNGALVPMMTGVLLLAGAGIVMLKLNVVLTLVTMAAIPLFVLIIRGFSRKIDEQSRHYHETESALVSSLQESLSSIRAIQAFTLEPEATQQFHRQSEQSLEANQQMTRTQLLYGACAGFAVTCGTAAVVWVAGHEVIRGQLSVGDILVFLAYLGMLYQPVHTFSQSASVIRSASAQLKRVLEIVDALPDINESPGARTLPRVRGSVEFRKVCFHYLEERPVLKEINLKVEPGEVVALVGRTGAGKTTMASLLLRFYDPTAGAILLDGHDLRELRTSWLRRQVSIVLQEPILFATTVAENIGYGRPGASMEEIQTAARLAQADDFIRELANGYETVLGERGVNLSGGQRQRLSIARAFLKNAPILVLDEPTSALDTQTEQALLASMRQLMRGRTTFVIAHRLSTVRSANLVVVLENGTIIEQGSHAELLARETAYKKMYHAQWGDELKQGSTLVAAGLAPAHS